MLHIGHSVDGKRNRVPLQDEPETIAAAFVGFTRDYHGAEYRQRASEGFFDGLLPALDYARQLTGGPICVTDSVNMPYIFVLFAEQTPPSAYLSSMNSP